MNSTKIVNSTQEQAVAAWVGYLNQLRIENLFAELDKQDINFKKATDAINNAIKETNKVIASNRGGEKGLHGFIAEIAETGIGNARSNIEGKGNIYEWLDDNGISDLRRGTTEIQQKFYISGGDFSLGAVAKHFHKYPDYLKNGEKYQIPKDQYESIKKLYALSEKEAYKTLSNSGDGLTLNQWRKVHDFFENEKGIKFEDLEPSQLNYSEVQKGTIDKTYISEKENIKKINHEKKSDIASKNKSTLEEAGKATVTAAAIEGTATFATCIISKIKSGKSIKDFTDADWKEIAKESGLATFKGGVRGGSVYGVTSAINSVAPDFYETGISAKALTTYNKTAATTANAIVTASFGFAEQAYKYKKNEISELELYESAQIICLDASVSALSSLIGQVIIPVPVLGAIIGNAVGTMIYQFSKDSFNKKQQSVLEEYNNRLIKFDIELNNRYHEFVKEVLESFEKFLTLIENAFSPDLEIAFNGSIELAKECGVSSEEILDSVEKGLSILWINILQPCCKFAAS